MRIFKATLSLLLVLCMAMYTVPAMARTTISTDTGHLGNSQWSITSSGELIPNDNTYTIGNASYYPGTIYLGGVGKSSWGSVISPWEESGGTLFPTSYPHKMIFTGSTGNLAVTGVTVNSGDLTFGENGGTIKNETDTKFTFTESNDTLDLVLTSTGTVVQTSDGPIILRPESSAADGDVFFYTGGDADDYVEIKTATADTPSINFVGCNGTITAASGSMSFGNETIYTSGTASAATVVAVDFTFTGYGETISCDTDDVVRVKSDDEATILRVEGYESKDAYLQIVSDDGDNAGDEWEFQADESTNSLIIGNDTSVTGTSVTKITLATSGILTTTGDIIVEGTTPKVEIGDGGAEDNILLFDGATNDVYVGVDNSASDSLVIGTGTTVGSNSLMTISVTPTQVTIGSGRENDQSIVLDGSAVDWYAGIDDTDDDFTIGTGSTVGTNAILSIAYDTPTVTLGDGIAEDSKFVYDGNAFDYYVGLDDSDDSLVIGTGSTVGTNPALVIGTDCSVRISEGLLVIAQDATPSVAKVGALWYDTNRGGATGTLVMFSDQTNSASWQVIASFND